MARTRGDNARKREAAKANASIERERRPMRIAMQGWLRHHAECLRSSLSRLVVRPWATALTVLVIGVALALPLLLYVVLDNAHALSGGLREAREFTVFLKPEQDETAARAFAESLRQRPDVESVTLRTPEEGMAEFRSLSGFAEALQVLDANPLPSVLIVMPAATGVDAPALLAALEADAHVDMVQYDAAWRQRLTAILGFGERLMLALAGLLGLATLLVVGNTIRTDTQARAEEIAVTQLLGASDGFVRRPFLYGGLWYGFLGGLLAVAMVGAVELWLQRPLLDLLSSYQNRFALHGFRWQDALVVIGAGTLLGWVGAWIVTTRHLLSGRPQS